MKKLLFALIFCQVLFLVGCVPLYQPPMNAPRAELGVISDNSQDKSNLFLVFKNPLKCTGTMPMSRLPISIGEVFPIEANKLMTVAVLHLGFPFFAFSFYPEPNHTYWLHFHDRPGKRFDVSEVGELTMYDGNQPVNFIKRHYSPGLFSFSDCKITDIKSLQLKS